VRVIAFGTYQRDYPRNAQVRACLRGAGVPVEEHHVPVWDGRREAWSAGPAALARLVAAQARLALARIPPTDVVLVGYPGHPDMRAARRAARGRPVVFDPLVSLFDTLVLDRRRFEPRSLAGRALLALDRDAFGGADLVVADTEAHAAFYAERFGVTPQQAFSPAIQRHVGLGLLEWAGDRLRLTTRGQLLSNEVFVDLLPDEVEA